MGANFLLKKNAGISLSAEGIFIAITTWANQQVQHVLILWDSGKRPQLIKGVRGGVSGRGDLVSYVFILISYLFFIWNKQNQGSEVLQEFGSYKVMTEGLGVFIHAWKMNIFFLKGNKLMKLTSDQCLFFKNIIIKCKPQWIICSCFSVLRFTQT